MSSGGPSYFQQAENALSKFRLFGKDNKWTEAAELFTKSGNSYKSTRDWIHAGESYFRASECLDKAGKLDEAAVLAADSGKMYSKQPETSELALNSYSMAIRYYRENSKPINAARLLIEAGKIFQERNQIDDAIKVYKDAAQIYDDENQKAQAATQLSIVADLYCSQNNFLEASNLYKNVAIIRINDRLTQLASGEYCMKAVICAMAADDVIGAEILMKEFVNLYPAWERSKEYSMLSECDIAINDHNSEAFSEAVAKYDLFKRLDNWMTNILLVVKKLIDDVDIC